MTPEALQATLDLHAKWRRGEPGGARAYLADAYLADADLTGADLTGAYLADAYLAGANLAGANLAYAYLAGANLARANLARANLAYAYLAGANLARANLARANLARAYLADAYLADADLTGARLPLTSRWSLSYTPGAPGLPCVVHIGCKSKTIAEWDAWFAGAEEFDTPRSSPQFRQIHAHYLAFRAYLVTLYPESLAQ